MKQTYILLVFYFIWDGYLVIQGFGWGILDTGIENCFTFWKWYAATVIPKLWQHFRFLVVRTNFVNFNWFSFDSLWLGALSTSLNMVELNMADTNLLVFDWYRGDSLWVGCFDQLDCSMWKNESLISQYCIFLFCYFSNFFRFF